ncbi:MAG: RNA-binding transcriptional accessory protein, partial [Bacteroidales bacterium]|nr:RNA-binding transcriptional accessory protein [Bacteroidales bacterium]
MTKLYIDHISAALQVKPWQVENCIELISDGATIPFISRYRKERTGGLDETQVAEIKHYHLYFLELDKRKAAIIKSVSEQEKMTDDLQSRIDNEVDLQRLEDLYLPFRPKRRTKASIAKEKGLEPLAEAIFQFKTDSPKAAASGYLNENVADVNDALEGAGHIVAEWISEMPQVRSALRDLYTKWGYLSAHVVKGKEEEEESQKYLNYYNFRQKIDGIMPHRLLALLRGANEGVLSLK